MLMLCLLSDWGSTQIQASINGLAFAVSGWFIWYFGWLSLFIYWYWIKILIPKGVISFGIASLCFLFVESLTWFAADSECRIADVLAERDVVGLSLVLVGAKKRLVQVGFYWCVRAKETGSLSLASNSQYCVLCIYCKFCWLGGVAASGCNHDV